MKSHSPQLPIGILTAFILFASCALTAAAGESVPGAEQAKPKISPDLEPFLQNYFDSWSAGDMTGYRAHFHNGARIRMVEHGRVTMAMGADDFVRLQEQARGTRMLTERMTSFSVDEDDVAATVKASWILNADGGTTPGINRFTLIRDETGQWKIVSLLYYTLGQE